ncbi:hypothetical protein JYY36_003421 [Salmonella enterica subsp. diarizonae serovar 50:z:-]|nr:hypothetical protein [Salmonella enterica subsp. diarizonae serovar 50:z:-]
MTIDLPVIWFAIIVFATLMYIVMDGFDLGVGILFPFIRDKHDRDVMVNSVAPIWDGNETWLVLGATWLIMKSEDPLHSRMCALSRPLLIVLLLVMGGVSVWTPLNHDDIAERWFTLPNLYYFLPVPVLVLAFSVWLWRSVKKPESHARPFILTLGLIFLGFSGLGISIWPNIIPPDISLYAAAAPPQSQRFMLVGALIIIPIILAYTFWSYYVFRGKVRHGEGYH